MTDRASAPAAAEEAGIADSERALLAAPPFPAVQLSVIAATDHAGSPGYEAQWREIQKRVALLSPKGRFVLVQSPFPTQPTSTTTRPRTCPARIFGARPITSERCAVCVMAASLP